MRKNLQDGRPHHDDGGAERDPPGAPVHLKGPPIVRHVVQMASQDHAGQQHCQVSPGVFAMALAAMSIVLRCCIAVLQHCMLYAAVLRCCSICIAVLQYLYYGAAVLCFCIAVLQYLYYGAAVLCCSICITVLQYLYYGAAVFVLWCCSIYIAVLYCSAAVFVLRCCSIVLQYLYCGTVVFVLRYCSITSLFAAIQNTALDILPHFTVLGAVFVALFTAFRIFCHISAYWIFNFPKYRRPQAWAFVFFSKHLKAFLVFC